MRIAMVLMFTIVVALLCSLPAFAQDPVEPIDLVADSLKIGIPSREGLGYPPTLIFEFYFTVHAHYNASGTYNTDVKITLDGNVIYNEPLTITIPVNNDCGDYPDCSNEVCEIEITGADVIYHYCGAYRFWFGPGCDPSDPMATCDPLMVCACNAPLVVYVDTQYSGEKDLVATVDPNGTVAESDETNNTCMMSVVGTEESSWSAIKSLFE